MMEECIAYLDGEGAWHVVPHEKVIRCCDCKRWDCGANDVDMWSFCKVMNRNVDPTDYCSWAERKEE